MYRHIVIHYDEIALKAQKRGDFERLLVDNIAQKLGGGYARCRREAGQFVLDLPDGVSAAPACDVLSRVPGIAYLSPAHRSAVSYEAMQAAAVDMLRDRPFESFRIAARRHCKTYDFTSVDINRAVGAAVQEARADARVQLSNPDLTLKIEVTNKHAYLSVERIEGVGGLPTDARQKVVGLLSGGLDSPVAMFMMMKRGCEVVLVHFQNQNHETCAVEDKISRIAEQLARYQVRTQLQIVPFGDVQREIIKHVRASLRMLFYRRVMLSMAATVASTVRARFLVTGDVFSQVASQTYDNLATTYTDATMPVLSPLMGMNKQEIVVIARKIGTFDISALPYDDCCSFFVARHPELRARPSDLRQSEAKTVLEPLVEQALADVVIRKY